MLVNPIDFVKGVEEGTGYSVPVNAASVEGYQGNPFVMNSAGKDAQLDRETYELQTMIDPGDPEKKREINHMYPGVYKCTSDVYLDLPEGYFGVLYANKRIQEGGGSVMGTFAPGFKGLMSFQLRADGGEFFFEPGEDVAELIVQKIEG